MKVVTHKSLIPRQLGVFSKHFTILKRNPYIQLPGMLSLIDQLDLHTLFVTFRELVKQPFGQTGSHFS